MQGAGGWGAGVNMVAPTARPPTWKQSRVSAGYFEVLGILPFIGREFNADEDRPGGPPAAILSHALWTRVFGSDSRIVGAGHHASRRAVYGRGRHAAGFNGGRPTDVWTPVRSSASGEGGGTNYGLIARLRPGISRSRPSAEVDQLGSPVIL